MISYNNLYDSVCDIENIHNAIRTASRKKKKKSSVKKVLYNEDSIAKTLSEQLKKESWRPQKVHNAHEINDGIQMKKRIIVTPNFAKEQIVHHALINVISPIFMKKFYRWSCGSIPGRGQEDIVRYLRKKFSNDRRENFKYCCKMDIEKFFNTISPLGIFKEIRRTIADKKLLILISNILRSNTVVDNKGNMSKGGIPIGFFTSPWFANIALNRIDHIIKDKHRMNIYIRYMDDMIIFHSNKRELMKCCNDVKNELEKLNLKLKHGISVHRFGNGRERSIRFTGFSFDGKKVYLHDKVFLKSRRISNKILKKRRINQDSFTIYDARRLVSISSRFRVSDTKRAFSKYILNNGKISIRKCREKISKDDKFNNLLTKFQKIWTEIINS